MSRFVHLHNHTEYSLLDGLSKIPKLVKTAKDLGMDALALTDHGALYGAIEFYKACLDHDVKPIIGAELYVARRSHRDKEGKADTEPFHLTILAKNYQGYLNLMKLISIAHLEGYYYKPRVDKQLLKEFHEGLMALSGCPASEFIKSLDSQDLKKAEEVARNYLEIFGEGNFYFEVQNHFYAELLGSPDLDEYIRQDLQAMGLLQELTWQACKRLSPKLGIPIVATNDCHYVREEDAEAQDALLCIQTGKFISDIQRLRMIDTPNLYLKSPDEMKEAFKELPEAVAETVKIAKVCNLEIPLAKAYFPVFDISNGQNAMDYLRELTFRKAAEKVELSQEIKERLEYELEIIEDKNYADYFLVVADFMDWAHQRGIITNTRGSAAGSLVLYCLGVTNLNPLDYLLPFERFLTKFRPTMPDIDVDLADDRRDEVIRYLMGKYGHEKVAHIVTFGTMMGRAAVRDVGRVLAIPYGEVDRIAKLIPPPHQGFHKPLKDCIREVPELAELYRTDPQYKKLLDLAVRIEGTVRHASVHAAGIVIAPEGLTNFAPLQLESNGDKVVIQYDMFSAIEEYGGVGLIKMDLLGIRNLSILGRAVEFVKQNRQIEIDLNQIPLDDKKAFELLARGETMGIFQLGGSGMTRYLMELKPTSVSDLAAMVALYRPGPMGIIPEYIARKNNPQSIKYMDPRMKEYMEQSLGLLVYQEDLLYTAINLAGYSWEEADKFRKAVGKKNPAEMAKQKDKFVEGCVTNGMDKPKAEHLFDLMAPFSAYGFNKAHAASYAMVAYQTAFMKANFPVEFMAAVMTAEYGDTNKVAQAIEECKKLEIVVLPPDINFSGVGFTIEELKELSKEDLERQLTDVENKRARQGIRFGLSAIKNVGILAIESILKAREAKPFEDLYDLCSRVDTRLVNRKTIESLIKAGALDSFGTRSSLLVGLDLCLSEVHKNARSVSNGQTSLFDDEDVAVQSKFRLEELEEMPLEQLLVFEKELLGFYLHEPPFLNKLKQVSQYSSVKLSEMTDELVGSKVNIGGVITQVKKVITKKTAQEMAFMTLADGFSEIECVIFPTLFAQNKQFLEKEEVVLCVGKLDKREDKLSLIVERIDKFDAETFNREPASLVSVTPKIEIAIPKGSDGDLLKKVNATLRKFPGSSPITLLIPTGSNIRKMSLNLRVKPDLELVSSIEQILGPKSVRLI